MRPVVTTAFLLIGLACLSFPAAALYTDSETSSNSTPNLPGYSCSSSGVGVTRLADDKVTIIACLYAGSSSAMLVWKPMTPIVMDTNGRAGIGTASPVTSLDVAGDIKIGQASTTCSSTMAGAVRFNSSTNVFEYCNGSAWSSCASSYFNSGGASPTSVTIPAGQHMQTVLVAYPYYCKGEDNNLVAGAYTDMYQCQNGAWASLGHVSGPGCTDATSSTGCSATAASSAKDSTCVYSIAALSSGSSRTVSCSGSSYNCSRTYTCSSGALSAGTESCSAADSGSCSAETATSSYDRSCTYSVGALSSGSSTTVSCSGSSYNCSRTYTCSSGSLSAGTESCSKVAAATCSAETITISDDAAVFCYASVPETPIGSSVAASCTYTYSDGFIKTCSATRSCTSSGQWKGRTGGSDLCTYSSWYCYAAAADFGGCTASIPKLSPGESYGASCSYTDSSVAPPKTKTCSAGYACSSVNVNSLEKTTSTTCN